MPHIKHATIGALVASLVGALMGLLLWARQLDYRGPNQHAMRVIGLMGLGLVTVAVAVACLSIAFLQYLTSREREEASVDAAERRSRLARGEV
jgi:high-affinity nickel permease